MDSTPLLLSAIIAFTATMSAAILIHRIKTNYGILSAFGSGVILALVIFEMVPAIMTLIPRANFSAVLPLLSAVTGFFVLFGLVKFFSARKKLDKSNTQKIGLISTAEFCSHSFLEGLAIGVGFQFQFSLGLVIAVAVISHDFIDGLSTLALMLNTGNSMRASLVMLFLDAIAPVVGAIAVLFLTIGESVLLLALSFLVGSFIYIGGVSLLPQAYALKKPRLSISCFLVGFSIILLLSVLTNTVEVSFWGI